MLLFFTQMLNIVNQRHSASGVHSIRRLWKVFRNRKNLGVLNTSERTQRGKKYLNKNKTQPHAAFFLASDAVSLYKGCKRQLLTALQQISESRGLWKSVKVNVRTKRFIFLFKENILGETIWIQTLALARLAEVSNYSTLMFPLSKWPEESLLPRTWNLNIRSWPRRHLAWMQKNPCSRTS